MLYNREQGWKEMFQFFHRKEGKLFQYLMLCRMQGLLRVEYVVGVSSCTCPESICTVPCDHVRIIRIMSES